MHGRLFLGLAAVLALSFLLSGAANGRAGAEGDVFPSGRIDPNVVDALKTKPWVEVFVALAEPPAAAAASLDLSALRQQVATGQSDVLLGLTGADFRLVDRYEAIPSLFGTVSAAGVAKLAAHPNVVRVYLPPEVHFTLGQSVPLINADDVHLAGFTGAGVVVAPLDSGIEASHSDLQDDLIDEHCFADSLFVCPGGGSEAHGPGSAPDNNGHGTHVSGIISSGGVVAPTGVAPDAGLIMFKIGDSDAVSVPGALKALDYIINNPGDGVRVVNMSWGGTSLLPQGDLLLQLPRPARPARPRRRHHLLLPG
jgi:subtilisin family serine protease